MAALFRLALLVGVILVLPLLAPYDPMTTDTSLSFQPPTMQHLLGTDQFGRDVLSRALFGGRQTLLIALSATALAALCGAALGIVSGSASSRVSALVASAANRLINALFAIPGLIFALVVVTLLGSGVVGVALATGISQIAPFARLTQTAAQQARAMPHVEAARALGASERRIIRYHILPNMGAGLLAAITLTFAYSLLTSAALTALGLGSAPGTPDWGMMLYEGRQAFRVAPWVAIVPGLAITALVWSAQNIAQLLQLQRKK